MDKYLMDIEEKQIELENLEKEIKKLVDLEFSTEKQKYRLSDKNSDLYKKIEDLRSHKTKIENLPNYLKSSVENTVLCALFIILLASSLYLQSVSSTSQFTISTLKSLLATDFLVTTGIVTGGLSTGFYFFNRYVIKINVFNGKTIDGISQEIFDEMQSKKEIEDELALVEEKYDSLSQQLSEKRTKHKNLEKEIRDLKNTRRNAINQILEDLLEQQLENKDSDSTGTRPFMIKKVVKQSNNDKVNNQ